MNRWPLVFCALRLLLPVTASGVLPNVEVRHAVIRVPEADFLSLWLKPATDDEIDANLWEWVNKGKATLISDIETSTETRKPLVVTHGRHLLLPSENAQAYDELVLIPTAFEEVLVGTELKYLADSRLLYDAGLVFRSDWQVSFNPAAPVVARWPVTWPRNPAQRMGWYDRPDKLIERVTTSTAWNLGGRAVLAVMRPADAVFPAAEAAPTRGFLDVMLTRVQPGDGIGEHTVEGRDRPPTGSGSVAVISITLDSQEALRLLLERDPAADADLLEALLGRVAKGSAVLSGFTSAAAMLDQRVELESGRRHAFPTEMPTIPSAWDERLVGTELTVEVSKEATMELSLAQDLAPPRHAVWQVALDAPQMIMREPQFVSLTTRTRLPLPDCSTVLQSALHIPDCLGGQDGVRAQQTVLTFTKHRKLKKMEPEPATEPGGLFFDFGHLPELSLIEVTAIVLEVPGTEEDRWKGESTDLFKADLQAEVLRRVADGSAKIAALAVGAFGQGEGSFGVAEDFVEVTEFEPDYRETPGRLRPTALETFPVGTVFSGSIKHEDDQNLFSYKLVHHLARPVMPNLAQMIDYAKAHQDQWVPAAQIDKEDWEGEQRLVMDKMTLLKMQRTQTDKLHLLLMRATEIPLSASQ
ncbi:MAG: hypothetical protein H7A55_09405 [Verrucomicrobiaceae bacterium]|nr:hypothetical protein [Verrucomicrobiaceae bacterium]